MVATSTASILIAIAFFTLGFVVRGWLDPIIDKAKALARRKKTS